MDGVETKGTVLLVEDDEDIGRIVGRYLHRWKIEQVYSGHEAIERIESMAPNTMRLAIVDLNLPDGRAFDPADPQTTSYWVVDRFRRSRPSLPVVVFTAYSSPALVNAAHLLGASFIVKEDYSRNLRMLARRLAAAEHTGDWNFASRIGELGVPIALTVRETDVVALATRGYRIVDIAERLTVSVNTVKTHVKRILEKTGCSSLRELVRRATATERGLPASRSMLAQM